METIVDQDGHEMLMNCVLSVPHPSKKYQKVHALWMSRNAGCGFTFESLVKALKYSF